MEITDCTDKKSLINAQLLELSKAMPMKQINTAGQPYMQRHFAGRFKDGFDLLLHRWLSPDGEEHMHNHGFEFQSKIAVGGMTEQKQREGQEDDYNIRLPLAGFDVVHALKVQLNLLANQLQEHRQSSTVFKLRMGGDFNYATVFDFHRIAAIEPMTWSIVIVDPRRLPQWYFLDGNGITPVGSSPRDWWKDYKVRPKSGVCAGDDDNRIVRF